MRATSISPSLQETRKPEEIQALTFVKNAGRFGEHCIDFAEKRCKSAQVHLIVPHDPREWLRRSPSQVVEIMLRNQG